MKIFMPILKQPILSKDLSLSKMNPGTRSVPGFFNQIDMQRLDILFWFGMCVRDVSF